MADDREQVLAAVRAALEGTTRGTPLPEWEPDQAVSRTRMAVGGDLPGVFAANFTAAGGVVCRSLPELAALLTGGGHVEGYCDPALRDAVGRPLEKRELWVHYAFERTEIERFTFAVTRATRAVAESGSLVLDDFETTDRLAAIAPWVHVAVLDPTTIAATVPEAIGLLGEAPNTVWVTGPSKTADIEGILVEGVHGPGVQVCLLVDASGTSAPVLA